MVPNFHVINALPPVADAFDTAMDTDIIDAGVGDGVLFIIQEGATAGAGVSTVTVEASSTIAAAAVATVPFVYRQCVATDVWGAWTAATAAGFSATMTAANSMWQIYVDSAEIAEEGYRYVRLSTDETGDFAVLAGVLAIVVNPRYGPTTATALD
jgi:hypothetical protein